MNPMTNTGNDNRTLKGKCGICGVNVFDDDERWRRKDGEDYICVDCFPLVQGTKCEDCAELFECPMDFDNTRCK